MSCLLNADLKDILKSIPNGEEIVYEENIPYHKGGVPSRIKKISDSVWQNVDANKVYPIERIMTDIANKRISVGRLFLAAEKNKDFSIELDENEGTLRAYNVSLEEMKERKNKRIPSDALIVFREVMPKRLVEMGLADSPVKCTKFVFDKIVAKAANWRRNGHHFNEDELIAICKELDNPLAVIKTETNSGDMAIAILTRRPDYYGNPTLVILAEDNERGDNYIASVYGRAKVANYLYSQQEKGNLVVVNPFCNNSGS